MHSCTSFNFGVFPNLKTKADGAHCSLQVAEEVWNMPLVQFAPASADFCSHSSKLSCWISILQSMRPLGSSSPDTVIKCPRH